MKSLSIVFHQLCGRPEMDECPLCLFGLVIRWIRAIYDRTFVGSWIMQRVSAERMLFYCATGTVVTTTVVLLDLGLCSLIALLCGYAFEAIMFPTIFALSLKGLGNHTKRASSFLMMSPVGGVVGPLLMGYVADTTTMVFAFVVPWVAYAIVWLYARKMLSVSVCTK